MAQGRAGSIGAIQLPSSQRNVALFVSMPAVAKEQGVVRKGKTNIRPTKCTPLPPNSIIFPELLGLRLISFSMIFQGSWFVYYPELSLLPLYLHHSLSGRTSASAPTSNKGFLLYPVLQNRGSCCAPWGFFRKSHTTIRSISVVSYLLSQFFD